MVFPAAVQGEVMLKIKETAISFYDKKQTCDLEHLYTELQPLFPTWNKTSVLDVLHMLVNMMHMVLAQLNNPNIQNFYSQAYDLNMSDIDAFEYAYIDIIETVNLYSVQRKIREIALSFYQQNQVCNLESLYDLCKVAFPQKCHKEDVLPMLKDCVKYEHKLLVVKVATEAQNDNEDEIPAKIPEITAFETVYSEIINNA